MLKKWNLHLNRITVIVVKIQARQALAKHPHLDNNQETIVNRVTVNRHRWARRQTSLRKATPTMRSNVKRA